MTHYFRPTTFEFTALVGADILAPGDHQVSIGDTITMPTSAEACITVLDNDGSLSGDAWNNEYGDDCWYQIADIEVNGTLLHDNVRIYAESYTVLTDAAGNSYCLIEIEVAGQAGDDSIDFFSFSGDVPPPGAELTVVGKGNFTYNWVSYRDLSAGLKWTPDADGKITIEAEDMALRNYRIDEVDAASGGEVIRLKRHEGEAALTFGGADGTYDLELAYIDENDGQGQIEIYLGETLIFSIDLTADNNGNGNDHSSISTVTIADVDLSQGDEITLRGIRDAWEFARIDALTFCPVDNTAPLAEDQEITLDEDMSFSGQLVASDAEGDTLSFALAAGPANGSVTIAADGSYSYTPAAEFNGADSFTFTVDDGIGGTATGTVSITVAAVNDGPAALADAVTLDEDNALLVAGAALLTNDSDVDGDTLTVTAVTSSDIAVSLSGGDVLVDPGSQFQSLAAGETASVLASYTVEDGNGGSAMADIAITVTGVNDGPVFDAAPSGLDLTDEDDGQPLTGSADLTFTDIDLNDTGHTATVTGVTRAGAVAALAGLSDADLIALLSLSAVTKTVGSTNGGLSAEFTADETLFDGLDFGQSVTLSYEITLDDGDGGTDTTIVTVSIAGAIDPLFTSQADGVDFDTVVAGSYLDGSQYDALGGEDTVLLPEDAGAAAAAGYDLTRLFDAGGGNDAVTGGSAGDNIFGNGGDDTLRGDGGDDTLSGGEGADLLQGGTGSDSVAGAAGNDTAVYNVAANVGASDIYSGNGDIDTLCIELTAAEFDDPAIRADLQAYRDFLAANTDPVTGLANAAVFQFTQFDLRADSFETLRVLVDGEEPMPEPPVQTTPFGPAFVFINQTLDYSFGADAFEDSDEGGAITYSATLVGGGALPGWLSFDATTRTFSGTPDSGDVEAFLVEITATEPDGQSASVVVPFGVLDGNLIEGTPGRDTLPGTVDGDLIRGFEDNDTLTGELGIDAIQGGDGRDSILGGDANDVLFGEGDGDWIFGDAGDDVLFGGDGGDSLIGGAGNDYIDGGAGNDTFSVNGGGADTLIGGDGNDRFTLSQNNVVFAGDGNDTVTSASRFATIDLGAGDDQINLGLTIFDNNAVPDVLTLGSGVDTILLSTSVDFRIFREFTVTDFATGPGGDVVNIQALLSRLSAWDEGTNPFDGFLRFVQVGSETLMQVNELATGVEADWVTMLRMENVTASDLTSDNVLPGYNPQGGPTPGNVINGTAANDTLTGGVGDDTIEGLDGNDSLNGDAGNDAIRGGLGNDSLRGLLGNDTIEGGDGADTIRGENGDDSLIGGGGNDFLFDGNGNDTIEGGDGDDVISIGGIEPTATDFVFAGAGNDRITVQPRTGGAIDAGDGDDLIRLATGPAFTDPGPILTLGSGSDRVELTSANVPGSPIVITDFQTGAGGDVFDLAATNAATNTDGVTNLFTSGHFRLTQDGADSLFEYDADGAVGPGGFVTVARLLNVDVTTITADNLDPNFDPNGAAPVGQVVTNGRGTAGDDTITGDVGGPREIIEGGYGNDLIDGSGLNDNDAINGGPGSDTIFGSGQLIGGQQDDIITGYNRGDIIQGNQGDDVLNGGDGDDTLSGNSGNDLLNGDAGNDRLLYSGGGVDTLNGGDGNDEIRLINVSDDVFVDGGADNDLILTTLFNGNQFLTLGTGQDTIELTSASSIAAGSITITDFETGPSGDRIDFLAAIQDDGVSNPFGAGLARMVQEGSDAVLQLALGSNNAANYTSVITFSNRDIVDFTAENFVPPLPLDGDGVAGQTVIGTGGADVINGGFGDDTLVGDAGDDLLTGNNGADELLGEAGADTLEGGFGVDTLDGGSEDDRLVGGDRGDLLTGGAGADTFVFLREEDGGDRLTDFQTGSDVIEIDLSGFALLTAPSLLIDSAPATGDAVLTFDSVTGVLSFDADGNGAGEASVLADLDGASLAASDLIFV
ncbi:MAG: tandem-95 repeat protein [Silicimonas sp.]|nr:tandem-95 repeat protein [Silicimonas sp.]